VLGSRAGLPLLTWPGLAGPGVDAGVTTRHGGVSTGPYASLNLGLHVGDRPEAVLANRSRVAAAFGAGPQDLVFCAQPHGRTVAVVGDADRGRGSRDEDSAIPAADALVTATPGPVLVVLVADCVPLVLLDPVARVLAVVHAGWRGTVAGVTTAAVEAMTTLGARPADVVAGIGPAVAPDRYQVGPEVADAARAAGLDDAVRADGTGRFLFDLVGANARVLREAGVAAVATAGVPTGGDFFSHRAGAPTGRFAAVARLVP
jgi:hypothetical protein